MSDSSSMVLAVNTGSSALKFALFEMGPGRERRVAQGAVLDVGKDEAPTWLQCGPVRIERKSRCNDYAAALDYAFTLLAQQGMTVVNVVGHRIVHGGAEHVQPVVVDAVLLQSLHRLVPLAPQHLPSGISTIEAVRARNPDVRQVACFDTAFHATMPERAHRIPLPDRFKEVRRYGFHGLSYEYVMSTLGPKPPARIVIAHLGNGSSLCAVKDGQSVDTTMGFTPAGGVVMGTRTGDLDPGVLFYLARQHGLATDALERLVNRESGLAAVGGSEDMHVLLDSAPTRPEAALAIDMYCYAVKKQIGAYAAALGGLDLLVFTGGIGENAARVRAEVCRGLEAFGIQLDATTNASGAVVISAAASTTLVRIVRGDEDLAVARHAYQLRG